MRLLGKYNMIRLFELNINWLSDEKLSILRVCKTLPTYNIRHVHPPSNPPRSNEKEGVPLHFQLNSIALFFENLYIKPYEYDQI